MKRHRLFLLLCLITGWHYALAQTVKGALPSLNDERRDTPRKQQYAPTLDGGFVCENGSNRFTRALYGGPTDYRIETSDRPVFAVVKKGHHRNVSFRADDLPLDSTDYCRALYINGTRRYDLTDKRWGKGTALHIEVVTLPDEEGAVWRFEWSATEPQAFPKLRVRLCEIAKPRLQRNGDLGVDAPDAFEADPQLKGLSEHEVIMDDDGHAAYVVVRLDSVASTTADEAERLFARASDYMNRIGSRVSFFTPEPCINTLGSALCVAADGNWDGETWLRA